MACQSIVPTILLLILTFVSANQKERQKACGGKPADVVFVIDSSGSILFEDFEKQLRFTENLVDMFDIGPSKTRVGMISFSTKVIPQFGLGTNDDKAHIKHLIRNVKYQGGGTNTDEALKYIRTREFKPSNTRPNIPRIVIVLTDGMSHNMTRTVHEAELNHKQGITTFVIGIGSQVDRNELSAIASKPLDNYLFRIDNFDALNSIKEELAIKTCKVSALPIPKPVKPTPSTQAILNGDASCSPTTPLDMRLAFDSAGIGVENSKFVLRFIADISDRLDMPKSHAVISTVTNGCASEKIGDLLFGSGHDREKLEKSLSRVTKGTPSLMRKLRISFRRKNGDKRVGILFLADTLDGFEYRKALKETRRAAFVGLKVFVIGVGDRVNRRQASFLSSGRHLVFFSDSYEDLDLLEGPVLLKLCKFT